MKKIGFKKMLLMTILAFTIISLGACSEKLDKEKLSTIKYGMSEKEVEKELGKPNNTNTDTKEIKKDLVKFAKLKTASPEVLKDEMDSQMSDNIDEAIADIQATENDLTLFTYELGANESILLLFENDKLITYMFMESEGEKVSFASMEFWCL